MKHFLLLFPIVAGAMVPIQAGINGTLARYLEHPARAGLVSFTVGTIAIALFVAASGNWNFPPGAFARAPWWAWLGGLCGTVLVITALILAPRVGGALFFGGIIAGQLLCGLVLDHFGLLGYRVHPITLGRVVGVLLLFAGVLLIRRY